MKNYLLLILTITFAFCLQGCSKKIEELAQEIVNELAEEQTQETQTQDAQTQETQIKDALGNVISQDDTIPVKGKAIDGYLQGALVCIDVDENQRCGPNDPTAITGEGGNYSIDMPKVLQDRKPNILVFALAGSTIDEDDPSGVPITKGYSMSAPYGAKTVTPITTVVVEVMEGSDISQSEAEQHVKEKLNWQLDSIDADYIVLKDDAEKSQQAKVGHEIAKVLVGAFQKSVEVFEEEGQSVASGEDAFTLNQQNDKANRAYNAYLKESGLIEELLTVIEAVMGDSDSEQQSTDINTKIMSLENKLDKKVDNHIKINQELVELAKSRDDSFSLDDKTQLLKDYMGNGFYYNPTDDNDDDAFYGWYHELSLANGKFSPISMRYSESGWVSNEEDKGDDKTDHYDSQSGTFITFNEKNGIDYEFVQNGNLLLKQWNEIVTVDYKLDLSEKPLARIVAPRKNAKLPLAAMGEKFSEGAEAVSLKLRQAVDGYTVHHWDGDDADKNYNRMHYWDNDDQQRVDIESLDKLLQAFKFESGVSSENRSITGQHTRADNNLKLQFHLGDNYKDSEPLPTSGKVYLYDYRDQVVASTNGETYESNQPYQLPAQGTWSREKLLKDDGQESDTEIVRIELPDDYLGSDRENVFYIAQADEENDGQTIVRRGDFRPQGVESKEIFLLNETAMNDIKTWVQYNDYTYERHHDHDDNNNNNKDNDDDVFLNDLATEVTSTDEKKKLAEAYFKESYNFEFDDGILSTVTTVDGKLNLRETFYRDGQWTKEDDSDREHKNDSDVQTLYYQPSSGKFEVGPDACEKVDGIGYEIGSDGVVKFDEDDTFEVEYRFNLTDKPLAWALFDQFEDNGEFYAPVELANWVMPQGSEAIGVLGICKKPNYYLGNKGSIIMKLGQNSNVTDIASLLAANSGIELTVNGISVELVYEDETQEGDMVLSYYDSNGEIAASGRSKWKIETLTAEGNVTPAKILTFNIPESFHNYFYVPNGQTPFLVVTESQDSSVKVVRIGFKGAMDIKDEFMFYNATAKDYIKEMIEIWAY